MRVALPVEERVQAWHHECHGHKGPKHAREHHRYFHQAALVIVGARLTGARYESFRLGSYQRVKRSSDGSMTMMIATAPTEAEIITIRAMVTSVVLHCLDGNRRSNRSSVKSVPCDRTTAPLAGEDIGTVGGDRLTTTR